MKKHVYHSLIAFFGGLFGASVLFILWSLILIVFRPENPFPSVLFENLLFYFLLISLTEEGTKFLLINREIGQFPYGFLLGFGFGMGETLLKQPFWELGIAPERRIGAILMHSVTAGILCYFVKKKKPVLGLAVAIVIHTGFNLVVHWAVQ